MFKTPKRLVFRIIVELDEAEWQDAEAPSSAARPQGPDTPQQKEAGQPGPFYLVNRAAVPPRRGSTNWEVWQGALKLGEPFSRSRFESVVGPAMRYDAATGKFGIPTNFPSLHRARQQYFAEFRKRGWIVEVKMEDNSSASAE